MVLLVFSSVSLSLRFLDCFDFTLKGFFFRPNSTNLTQMFQGKSDQNITFPGLAEFQLLSQFPLVCVSASHPKLLWDDDGAELHTLKSDNHCGYISAFHRAYVKTESSVSI